MICFLSAMEAEAQPVLRKSTILGEERIGFARLYRCSYEGVPFFFAVCGIGKVLSASGLSGIIVAHPEIDSFLNLGIGGSLDAEKAGLLSAVIGTSFVQHDMDTTSFGDPKGYLNGLDTVEIKAEDDVVSLLQKACQECGLAVYKGLISSGDSFVTDEEKKRGFVEDFGAISVDMEAAAYAETAAVYHKGFAALRIISDAVDHQNEYLRYKKQACEIGGEVALKFLSIHL